MCFYKTQKIVYWCHQRLLVSRQHCDGRKRKAVSNRGFLFIILSKFITQKYFMLLCLSHLNYAKFFDSLLSSLFPVFFILFFKNVFSFRFHNAYPALFSVAQHTNDTIVHHKLGELNSSIIGQNDGNVSAHMEGSTWMPGRPPRSLSPTG